MSATVRSLVPLHAHTALAICRSRTHASVVQGEGEGGAEVGKPYKVVDDKMKHLVAMPIGEDVKGNDIECKITKTCLLLIVNGKRIIDGEMWGEVIPNDSSWEIDEYENDDRCIVIRLQKKSKEDWPFVIRGDYDLKAVDWANRRVVSRADVSKQDVSSIAHASRYMYIHACMHMVELSDKWIHRWNIISMISHRTFFLHSYSFLLNSTQLVLHQKEHIFQSAHPLQSKYDSIINLTSIIKLIIES